MATDSAWLGMDVIPGLNCAPYSPVQCSSSMRNFELPVVEREQSGETTANFSHSACTARAQRTVRPLMHRYNVDSLCSSGILMPNQAAVTY